MLERYIADDIMKPIIDSLKEHQLTKGTEIVRKVTKIVRDRRGDITLAECAEELNYHPSYLSRILRQEKGMSFINVINEEKQDFLLQRYRNDWAIIMFRISFAFSKIKPI